MRKMLLAAALSAALAAPALFAAPPDPDLRIAVANEHAVSLQFFDLSTGKLLKDIPTLRRPHEMVVDPKTGLAYVSIA